MLIAVLLAVALLTVAAVAVLVVRWWIWRTVVKRRVLVQTDADVAFEAILLARRGGLLVLADVHVLADGQESQRLDGTVVIERARVAWMQVR